MLGFVSAPEKVPLDSFLKEQGGYLCGISSKRPGHEGIPSSGELRDMLIMEIHSTLQLFYFRLGTQGKPDTLVMKYLQENLS